MLADARADAEVKGATTLDERSRGGIAAKGVSLREGWSEKANGGGKREKGKRERETGKTTSGQPEERTTSARYTLFRSMLNRPRTRIDN